MLWTEGAPDAADALATSLPVLVLSGRWETLFAQGPRRRLETDVLPAYLSQQRWFSAKARTIARSRLVDYCLIQATAPLVYLVLVEVTYTDGGAETYALILGISAGETAEALLQTDPGVALARLRGPQGEGLLHNAMGTDAAAAPLLTLIQEQRRLPSGAGEFRGFTTRVYPEVRGALEEPLAVRRVQTEQSNSSIVYGSRLILKFVRRVEAGINPELDIGRYLTEKAALPFVPPLAGGLTYRRPGTAPMTLALLHGYVRSGGNGWDYTLDLLGRYYEQTLGFTDVPVGLDMRIQSLLALAAGDMPEEARAAVGTYLVPAENLGQRTAALHLALAQEPSDPAFAPEPMTTADLAVLATDLCRHAEQVLEVLTQQADVLPEPLRVPTYQVVAQRAAILERLHAVSTVTPGVARIRTDLDQFSLVERDALMYHGYTLIDAQIRQYCLPLTLAYPASKAPELAVAPLFSEKALETTRKRDLIRKELEAGAQSIFLIRSLKKYPRPVGLVYV